MIKWGSHSNKHGCDRGSAVFLDISIGLYHVSPGYWINAYDNRCVIWGGIKYETNHTQECGSLEEARETADAFIRSEYKRHLSAKLKKLDDERALVQAQIDALSPP